MELTDSERDVLLDDLFDSEVAAFLLYCDNQGLEPLQQGDINDDALSSFRDDYLGSASTMREWAEEWLSGIGYFEAWSEAAIQYFDIDSWINDFECSGGWSERDSDYNLHVFN